MTALADALKKAGVDTDANQLYARCLSLIRQVGESEAVNSLTSLAQHDTAIARALAKYYIQGIAKDRDRFSPRGEASGHRQYENHGACAARKVEGDEGQSSSAESQCSRAPSPSSKHDGKGQISSAHSHERRARPVVPTSRSPQERRTALRAAGSVARITILDTYKLATGEVLGDLTFDQIANRQGRSLRDGFLLKQIRDHVQAPGHVRVRDAVKPEQVQVWHQKAAELADAA